MRFAQAHTDPFVKFFSISKRFAKKPMALPQAVVTITLASRPDLARKC